MWIASVNLLCMSNEEACWVVEYSAEGHLHLRVRYTQPTIDLGIDLIAMPLGSGRGNRQ